MDGKRRLYFLLSHDFSLLLKMAMMAKLREHHNQTALAQSVEEGMRRQAQTRYRRINKQAIEQSTPKKVGCVNGQVQSDHTPSLFSFSFVEKQNHGWTGRIVLATAGAPAAGRCRAAY